MFVRETGKITQAKMVKLKLMVVPQLEAPSSMFTLCEFSYKNELAPIWMEFHDFVDAISRI